MKYNIILEGCDGVGKTTVAQILRNRLNMAIYSPNRPQHKMEGRKQALYLINMMRHSSGLIFDRSHLSEFVYAPLYRNYDARYILDFEIPSNTYAFILTAITDDLIERFDGEFINTSDIANISAGYFDIFWLSKNPRVRTVSTSGATPEEVADIIIKSLGDLKC